MHEGVLFYIIVAIGSVLGGIIGQAISARLRRRRTNAFLRYARVVLPSAKSVEVISVASSDKQAIENIERRLRNASRTL